MLSRDKPVLSAPMLLPIYGEELSTDVPHRSDDGRSLGGGERKMTTDQKPASAGVTSARREIANGFLLVLGLVLYLLGPVGILFGIPLIVTAFDPSKVKKVVAIVYLILILAVAALMVWQRAPQVQHDQQLRQRNELALHKLEHEHANAPRRGRVRSEAWR